MLTFFDFRENIITKSKGTKIIVDLVFRKDSQLLPGVNTTVGVWSNLAYCTAITFLPRDSWALTCLGKHYTSMDYLKTLCQWSLLGELSRITIRQLSVFTIHGTVGRTLCHWSLWSITRNSLIDIFFDRFPGQLGSHSFEQTHCKQCQWSLGSISISGIKSLPDNLTFLLLHALENTLPLMTWNNNQDITKDKYSTKWSQKKGDH